VVRVDNRPYAEAEVDSITLVVIEYTNILADAVVYNNLHKKQKCYKCKKYGHLAKDCSEVCARCQKVHRGDLCQDQIVLLMTKLINYHKRIEINAQKNNKKWRKEFLSANIEKIKKQQLVEEVKYKKLHKEYNEKKELLSKQQAKVKDKWNEKNVINKKVSLKVVCANATDKVSSEKERVKRLENAAQKRDKYATILKQYEKEVPVLKMMIQKQKEISGGWFNFENKKKLEIMEKEFEDKLVAKRKVELLIQEADQDYVKLCAKPLNQGKVVIQTGNDKVFKFKHKELPDLQDIESRLHKCKEMRKKLNFEYLNLPDRSLLEIEVLGEMDDIRKDVREQAKELAKKIDEKAKLALAANVDEKEKKKKDVKQQNVLRSVKKEIVSCLVTDIHDDNERNAILKKYKLKLTDEDKKKIADYKEKNKSMWDAIKEMDHKKSQPKPQEKKATKSNFYDISEDAISRRLGDDTSKNTNDMQIGRDAVNEWQQKYERERERQEEQRRKDIITLNERQRVARSEEEEEYRKSLQGMQEYADSLRRQLYGY
jgi:hypothetical protein